MKSSARRKGVMGKKHSPWKGFQASAAVKRRKEQEAAKAACGTSIGKRPGQSVQEKLDRISDQIAAERSPALLSGKPAKVFETVAERLKRLNEARAMRKLQIAGAVSPCCLKSK